MDRVNSILVYLLDQKRPVLASKIGADLGIEHEELYAHLVRLEAVNRAQPRATRAQAGHRMGWVAT